MKIMFIIIGIFVLYGIIQTYALCAMAGFYSRMEEDDPNYTKGAS